MARKRKGRSEPEEDADETGLDPEKLKKIYDLIKEIRDELIRENKIFKLTNELNKCETLDEYRKLIRKIRRKPVDFQVELVYTLLTNSKGLHGRGFGNFPGNERQKMMELAEKTVLEMGAAALPKIGLFVRHFDEHRTTEGLKIDGGEQDFVDGLSSPYAAAKYWSGIALRHYKTKTSIKALEDALVVEEKVDFANMLIESLCVLGATNSVKEMIFAVSKWGLIYTDEDTYASDAPLRESLKLLGKAGYIEVLNYLNSRNVTVDEKILCVRLIADSGLTEAAHTVQRFMRHTSANLKFFATEAYFKLKGRDAWPEAVEMLEKEDESITMLAKNFIINNRINEANEPLSKILSGNKKLNANNVEDIISTMAELNPEMAIESFFRMDPKNILYNEEANIAIQESMMKNPETTVRLVLDARLNGRIDEKQAKEFLDLVAGKPSSRNGSIEVGSRPSDLNQLVHRMPIIDGALGKSSISRSMIRVSR